MVNGREPYLTAAGILIAESGCTIRRWRKGTTGCAYTQAEDWGIEVPEPRGPVSYGTFAHEVGHQMLHRHNSKPRWLEEVEAWEWALDTFARFELPGHNRVLVDATACIVYGVRKTIRRAKKNPAATRALIEGRLKARWPIAVALIDPQPVPDETSYSRERRDLDDPRQTGQVPVRSGDTATKEIT